MNNERLYRIAKHDFGTLLVYWTGREWSEDKSAAAPFELMLAARFAEALDKDSKGAEVVHHEHIEAPETLRDGFDYLNQAWVVGGVYVRCGHPPAMSCDCYGRLHEGMSCTISAEVASGWGEVIA